MRLGILPKYGLPAGIASIVCLLATGVAGSVRAAAVQGNALTVTPVSQDLTVAAGHTASGVLTISNPTDQTVQATVGARDFKAVDASGNPTFYTAQPGDPHLLATWFQFLSPTVAVAPGTVESIPYSLAVPSGAEPGGHYGAAFFTIKSASPVSGDTTVSINTVIGSLFLVTVPGTVASQAQVTGFSANRSIIFHLPVHVLTTVSNSGNVHVRPFGEIVVKDWLGRRSAILPLNPDEGAVLPGSSRTFDATFAAARLPGPYKLELAGLYGANSVLSGTSEVWYLPPWLLIGLPVLLVLAILLIRFVPRIKISLR